MPCEISEARLYAILDLGYVSAEDLEDTAQKLIDGGADLLQLRAKGHSPQDIEAMALRVLPICRAAKVPFIVNDFPGIALKVGADGLHIGQDDGSLEEARAIVGASMIVGRSTHSPEQAKAAVEEGFDYIGFGPLFPTPTKQGRPGIGMENIKWVESLCECRIPAFCIGGIKRDNLSEVLAAGARRVVIVSDLLMADDITAATQSVAEQLS